MQATLALVCSLLGLPAFYFEPRPVTALGGARCWRIGPTRYWSVSKNKVVAATGGSGCKPGDASAHYKMGKAAHRSRIPWHGGRVRIRELLDLN